MHHAFLLISLPFLHKYDVKWPNFKSSQERERYCIDFLSSAISWLARKDLKSVFFKRPAKVGFTGIKDKLVLLLVLFSANALIPSLSIPEITMSFSSLLAGGWIRKEPAEEDEFEVDFKESFCWRSNLSKNWWQNFLEAASENGYGF